MRNLILLISVFAGVFLLFGCLSGQQSPPPDIPKTNVTLKIYSMGEISQHNVQGNCWLIIHNQVVDVSDFTKHPGGDAYVPYCGKEATTAFETKGGDGSHSNRAKNMIETYVIGQLAQ